MLVAGLMSGTSADAIDVALVNIRGRGWNARVKFVGFYSMAYPPAVRSRVLSVAGGAASSAREISQLNVLVGELFGSACLRACQRLRIPIEKVALIGSHGQTIHHQPHPVRECGIPVRSTLQIGEPAVIAARTGVATVGDFRPGDIAAGGQGAPLVPFFDYCMFRHRSRGRIALNIGGIANITVIPAGAKPGDVRAFDTGPGNMMIDQLVTIASGGRQTYDRGGRLASRGTVDELLVRQILKESYFKQRPPKSTGRELFGREFIRRWFPIQTSSLRTKQLAAIATATALTAASIRDAIQRFVLPVTPIQECLVSGGGIYNPFLMNQLKRQLSTECPGSTPIRVRSLQDSPLPSRAKEAAAFALLAYQTLHGEASNLPSATGADRPVVLGKLVQVSR